MEQSRNVEIHKNICQRMNNLYEKKNADYGDSFAKLRSEYPTAICIRLQDKMNRLKSLLVDKNDQQINDESIEDTLLDIANYAVMEIVERTLDREKSNLSVVANKPHDIQVNFTGYGWGEK